MLDDVGYHQLFYHNQRRRDVKSGIYKVEEL